MTNSKSVYDGYRPQLHVGANVRLVRFLGIECKLECRVAEQFARLCQVRLRVKKLLPTLLRRQFCRNIARHNKSLTHMSSILFFSLPETSQYLIVTF